MVAPEVLHNGISNLQSDHFWTKGCKKVLMKPRSSFETEWYKLKVDISEIKPTKEFACKNPNYCFAKYYTIPCSSVYYDTAECVCSRTMEREVAIMEYPEAADGHGGVFTAKKTSYIISDNLKIFPNTKGFVQNLKTLGITEEDVGQPRNVTLRFTEIKDLLKVSLLSLTPLTDLILNKGQVSTPNSDPRILFRQLVMETSASNNGEETMILKVTVQKSTKKLLFAQANEDFIDFLCSLLAIPLGGVVCLLGMKTGIESIENLYWSAVDYIDDKYLATPDIRKRLMNPKLAHGYNSEYSILKLSEETFYSAHLIRQDRPPITLSTLKFVEGKGKYVRDLRMYQITDDLTVTPFCMASTISVLKSLKIALHDVEELEDEIGLDKARSILRASLTSTTALTDGLKISSLMNASRLMKRPKREREE